MNIENEYITFENGNIYCSLESIDELNIYIESVFKIPYQLRVLENESSDISICVSNEQDLFEFHVSKRKTGGDETSRMILGAYNFIKRIVTDAESNKAFILQHLASCNTSIGVKVLVVPTEKNYKLLLNLAHLLQGLIFTGEEMLDDQGAIVLDTDGLYSVIYE